MTNEAYVLDTDVLSLWQREREPLSTRLRSLQPDQRFITLITVIEQLTGRHQQVLTASTCAELLVAQERLFRTRRWLDTLSTLDFDDKAAGIFESLAAGSLGKLKRKDLLIASIVLGHNYVLVTRNVKDFQRVPGLKVEDWSR